jgi:sarcosine oxidase gamma subunit
VPRANGSDWFGLKGRGAGEVFSRLCGTNLTEAAFADLDVAQTLLARVGTVIIREDEGSEPAYHLISDVSFASYIWEAVIAALAMADRAASPR